MPAGTYEHVDVDGSGRLLERFRCAVGGSGWRYVSQLSTSDGHHAGSVDLTVDLHGRQLRVAVDRGCWCLRGGISGPELSWVRRPAEQREGEAQEHRAMAGGFAGVSPAFLVATAAMIPRTGEPARMRLVALSGVLGTRRQDQQWAFMGTESHPAETGSLDVSAYEVVDLDTAERETVHIAGDVVLAAASIGLVELDSPPGAALHELG